MISAAVLLEESPQIEPGSLPDALRASPQTRPSWSGSAARRS
jgi:hypothetical protein